MHIYDLFRFGHGILLITIHIVLIIGILLEWRRNRQNKQAAGKVSVIIPVHNESTRIKGLLRTLLGQSYPAQIIFIDDRSTDDSPAMLKSFAQDAEQRGIDCKIITLKENHGKNKKQFALLKGIKEANGDYFLFTDGDCEVPHDWIHAMVSHIQDEKTGVAIGPIFKKRKNKGFFSLFQCYDHVIRYTYLKGSTGLGAASGGFGNNMIINRKLLEAIGGYDAVPSSPTEDAALISHIRHVGGVRVSAISDIKAAVDTEAEYTWREFINQTLRWNNGGIFSPDLLTRINYNILMLVISTGILAIPFLPFIPSLWPLTAGVYISMTLNHIAVFSLFGKKMPGSRINIISGYFLTLLFMPVYITLMTIMSYLRIKTTWKNETVNR